jgi:uncharacterized membrane protein YfcA
MTLVLLAAIGLVSGIASGLFGVGGGILIVPALMLLMKFPTHTAMATSLVALLLPVGAWAVCNYYASGKITNQHIIYGLVIGACLFVGAFIGSKIALSLDQATLRKGFAAFLVFAAVLVWFKK